MAFRNVHALLGSVVSLATMVLAPYPLVIIGASEMIGGVLNAPCVKACLLGSDSLSLSFSISFSTVVRICGSFLSKKYCKGDGILIGNYFLLVSMSGGLVIYIGVCHVDAELAGVKISRILKPFALLTLNVVKEIRAAGLSELLESKGKSVLLVKFDNLLSESVDIVLLLNLCQIVTDVVARLGEGELLDMSLLFLVVDNELRLDYTHFHL